MYPYGGVRAYNVGCAPNHVFTGKERDSESGLDNFGARYYSSQYGRFMSADWSDDPETVPYADFGDPQSLNLYSYVGNNPLKRSDPDGHKQVCDPDTYSTGPDGELIVHAGACHEVPDPPSTDDLRILEFANQMNKRPILPFVAAVYGTGAAIGSGVGAVTGSIATLGGSITTIGLTASRIAPLVPLLQPAGEKLAQMISRSGVGQGDPAAFMQYAESLRDSAVAAGTAVQSNYIQAGSTIYRVGNDFMTVAKDGKILSFVSNAEAGWGVAQKYFAAGGR